MKIQNAVVLLILVSGCTGNRPGSIPKIPSPFEENNQELMSFNPNQKELVCEAGVSAIECLKIHCQKHDKTGSFFDETTKECLCEKGTFKTTQGCITSEDKVLSQEDSEMSVITLSRLNRTNSMTLESKTFIETIKREKINFSDNFYFPHYYHKNIVEIKMDEDFSIPPLLSIENILEEKHDTDFISKTLDEEPGEASLSMKRWFSSGIIPFSSQQTIDEVMIREPQLLLDGKLIMPKIKEHASLNSDLFLKEYQDELERRFYLINVGVKELSSDSSLDFLVEYSDKSGCAGLCHLKKEVEVGRNKKVILNKIYFLGAVQEEWIDLKKDKSLLSQVRLLPGRGISTLSILGPKKERMLIFDALGNPNIKGTKK
ncbi:MAG: hypothetical protein CL678_07395 [Bdellovibrionaceae bacterium]|nr:hypothetical protein [Pseudobdellovibrionaceae bacterium]|tara:strand:- start:10201 stop:11319 length:1119 start_codon:yes stop_codon:yes gene_type:complete